MGKGSAPPPPPDYAAAARQTAAGNIEAAQLAQAQNMVNQLTPQGSVTYTPTQIGTTSSGAPIQQWTQEVQLSPEQRALYEQNQAINQALGGVAQKGVGYVQEALDRPLDFSQMQALQSPGELQQQAADAAYQQASRYLDPQFQQSQSDLESKLANMGITRGSEAWSRELGNLAMQREQAYGQARNQAYLQGMQGAGQQFGQAMGTRQQQISEAQALQQNPLNILNAVRTGQQMQVAQQPQVATSAPGRMATTAGPDLLGAAGAQYNAQLANYNAGQAQGAGMFGGAMDIAGLGVQAAGMFSDRRMKQNINKVGTLENGLNLYTFEYKPEFHDIVEAGVHLGVMADEAEELLPESVHEKDGYKYVDYGIVYGLH